MSIQFADCAWEEYLFWQQNNKRLLGRINDLIKDIRRNPFSGMGKPERLKYLGTNVWSRRIDEEHRLVYMLKGETIHLLRMRYHYQS